MSSSKLNTACEGSALLLGELHSSDLFSSQVQNNHLRFAGARLNSFFSVSPWGNIDVSPLEENRPDGCG
jgi:hypothetical protein